MPTRKILLLAVLVVLLAVAGVMFAIRREPAPRVSTATRPDDTTYVVSPISGKRHQLSEFKPMPGSGTMVLCPDTGKPIARTKLLAQTKK